MQRRRLFHIGIGCLLCMSVLVSCGQRRKSSPGQPMQPAAAVPSLTETACRFLGVPYKGGTLEHDDAVETLVTDTSAFDCVTLVETVMALYRWQRLPEGERDSEHYRQLVERIRYRNGVMTDYTSRLHYTSDWIVDNISKGFLKDVTGELAALGEAALSVENVSVPFRPEVYLMSRFPQRYPALVKHPEWTVVMIGVENRVNSLTLQYIPKEMVVAVMPHLKDGTIVAFTTNVKGLDFVHLGIICRVNGTPHLLHASSDAGKVVVSEQPLTTWLNGLKRFTGAVFLEVL